MTFNKQDCTAAYQVLGIRHHHDRRWTAALLRGWENLEHRFWQWDNGTLLIQSTSEPEKRYTVTADGCQCHAAGLGTVCDHVTSWWLCFEASKIHSRPPKMRRHYHDIDAAVDELF